MTASKPEPFDIWCGFNDIHMDGTVVTYADLADSDEGITVGAGIFAGDHEGNRCPATVVSVKSPAGAACADRITLRLDMDGFEAAPYGNGES